MPKISSTKKEKISEHILSILFTHFPKPLFTSHIAREIARDEEFTKILLKDLNKKELIIYIRKNTKGREYIKRIRWRLSTKAYNSLKSNKFL